MIDGRSNKCPNCGRSRSSMTHRTKCLGHNRAALRRARRNSRQTFSAASPALIMSVSGGLRQGGASAPVSLANGSFYDEHNAACRAAAEAVAA